MMRRELQSLDGWSPSLSSIEGDSSSGGETSTSTLLR